MQASRQWSHVKFDLPRSKDVRYRLYSRYLAIRKECCMQCMHKLQLYLRYRYIL